LDLFNYHLDYLFLILLNEFFLLGFMTLLTPQPNTSSFHWNVCNTTLLTEATLESGPRVCQHYLSVKVGYESVRIACQNVQPLCSKNDKMLTHLLHCEQVSAMTKDKEKEKKGERRVQKSSPSIGHDNGTLLASTTVTPEPVENQNGEHTAKCQKSDAVQQNLAIVPSKHWTPAWQHDFNQNIYDLFVACGIS